MGSSPQRVLVTGAGGFVGRTMVSALLQRGDRVVATGRNPGPFVDRVMDISDGPSVERCIAESSPDLVVHLAGMTYLPEVLRDQKAGFRSNVLGTQNLLEATKQLSGPTKVLLVSTCSVYGAPLESDLPLREDAPLRAMHPYGVQKIGLEVLGAEYAKNSHLDVRIVRPFNHVGPGLNPRLSLAYFAGQIVAAERGDRAPLLTVGNLEARRDICDVRDTVRAYLQILDLPSAPPILNVASGKSVRIGDALDALIQRSRIELTTMTDPARLRAADVPNLVGDATLLHSLTGWEPRIDLSETYDRILAEARGEDFGGYW